MFPRTLSEHAQNTLALLGNQPILKQASLAGGSSLALQIGHRRSIDFDFFSNIEFFTIEIKKELNKVGSYKSNTETSKTMVGVFNSIKFSYFYYPYPLIEKTKNFLGIQLASIEDIAAMKLVAITDRGTKKDYIDLFFITKKFFPIDKILKFYEKKYHLLQSNKLTILKALQYFNDADNSNMPEMIEKVDWNDVKSFFRKEVVRLTNKYI